MNDLIEFLRAQIDEDERDDGMWLTAEPNGISLADLRVSGKVKRQDRREAKP